MTWRYEQRNPRRGETGRGGITPTLTKAATLSRGRDGWLRFSTRCAGRGWQGWRLRGVTMGGYLNRGCAVDDPKQGWKPDGTAFCWQPKAALHRIREALDANNSVSSGLLVYFALTEIASDKRAHTFQATHAYIAMRCGQSPRTVQQRVKDLVSIGVIECTVPNLKAPATYTLLAVEQSLPSDTQPVPRDQQPLPIVEQPLPNVTQRSKNAPLPTYKECNEESVKNDKALSSLSVPTKPTKATKLSKRQKEIADRVEAALGDEWVNDAGKWINRIKQNTTRARNVIAEVENAIRERRVAKSNAAYAEYIWGDSQ